MAELTRKDKKSFGGGGREGLGEVGRTQYTEKIIKS